MKSIKIVPENMTAIETALVEVNGPQQTGHINFTSYASIGILADEAERKLEEFGLPKNLRAGASYSKKSGNGFAAAIHHNVIATTVRIERRTLGWYLTNVAQAALWPKEKPRGILVVTREQAAEATRRLLNTVTIAEREGPGRPSYVDVALERLTQH